MNAIKKAFPAGKDEYKCECESYEDTIASFGYQTWILTHENMKIELLCQGEL